MNGRPPKPDGLKAKLGTLRPGRVKPPLALVADGQPRIAAPRGLGKAGKAAWRDYTALGREWISPRTDRRALERLCRLYDEESELLDLVDAGGRLVDSSQGRISNPIVTQLRKVQELLGKLEGAFGFTPSDRSRLGLSEITRVSKLDLIMRGPS